MTGNGTLQLPPQASTVAHQVDSLYYFIFWGSVFFFVLIVGLSTIFVLRYRRRAGQVLEPSTTHNTPLEIAWTIIPLALVIVVFVWGFRGYMTLAVPPGNSLQYNVTGKKWLWEVTHPNGNVAVNEMTVPVGQPVKVTLRRGRHPQLLHPAFRVKQDALPNRYTTLWFEATMPGITMLFCASTAAPATPRCWAKCASFRDRIPGVVGGGSGWTGDVAGQWGGQLYKSKACITCPPSAAA
jgi:cytochrome c oxidase subunit 2